MKRMFYQVHVRDAEAAVDLYRRAFNAELQNRISGADGAILHAEMEVFGQILALSESSERGGSHRPIRRARGAGRVCGAAQKEGWPCVA